MNANINSSIIVPEMDENTSQKEYFDSEIKNLQERIAIAINNVPDNLKVDHSSMKQHLDWSSKELKSKSQFCSRNSSPNRKNSKDVNDDIVEIYKEYLQRRKMSSSNTNLLNSLQMEGNNNFNQSELGDTENELFDLESICTTVPDFGSTDNADIFKKTSAEPVQKRQASKNASCLNVSIQNNQNLLSSVENILGSSSTLSKILQKILQGKTKETNIKNSLDIYNIDQNDEVTRDKEGLLAEKENILSNKISEKEKLSHGDCPLELVGKKLAQLEQQIYIAKLESGTLTSLSLHDMLKKMWKQVEEIKSDLDAKIGKINEADRKEKKLLRNNIIWNYQNIAKMFKQCQNYEIIREIERNKVDEEFAEIYKMIGCKKTRDSNDELFKKFSLSNFMGRHVDFLPVLLMLIMYLITLILKH